MRTTRRWSRPRRRRTSRSAALSSTRSCASCGAALEALPPAQREVFLLREEAGLSLPEIAEVTGIDLEAAKSRLRYALAKLREAMGDG